MTTMLNRTTCRVDSLTPREQAVLSAMACGLSNHGIGKRLCLSQKTVEVHIGAAFAKLGLYADVTENRRVRAVLIWLGGQTG